MPEQSNGEKRPMTRRELEMDMDDFMDLRSTSSKKNGNGPKKRTNRGSRKSDLRDAMLDPDSMDEYMDEFEG
jgi:hypothetical protein